MSWYVDATLIGSIGVGLLLAAFLLNLAKVLRSDEWPYLGLNLIGAGLACYSSYLIAFMPFVVLEGTWATVALVGIVRRSRGKTVLRLVVLCLLALEVVAPVVAPVYAQAPKGRTFRVGWLSPASEENGRSNLDALRAGLGQLGYLEGRNMRFELRWADGKTDRLPALAAELTQLNVDVICTAGSQATAAAKAATSKVPVVFANVAFPDQTGLVESYARPGGNVTGVAFVGPEYGKRLEILKELRPNLSRVALIYNPENRGSVLALAETQRWTKSLGINLEPHQFRGPQDFPALFAAIERKLPDGLMTTADPLIASHRVPIVEFATKHRLVSMYPGLEFVEAGGLMFYGGSIAEMYRMAGVYIDRIFRGAAPRDLPVEQPVKFDMVINAVAAKALGLTIPRTLLLRADQVIQ
jgi:putative ABC transport system substrate-binding protein